MDTLELEPGEYEAAVEQARVRTETEPHATPRGTTSGCEW